MSHNSAARRIWWPRIRHDGTCQYGDTQGSAHVPSRVSDSRHSNAAENAKSMPLAPGTPTLDTAAQPDAASLTARQIHARMEQGRPPWKKIARIMIIFDTGSRRRLLNRYA